jgi:hypothetical protein
LPPAKWTTLLGAEQFVEIAHFGPAIRTGVFGFPHRYLTSSNQEFELENLNIKAILAVTKIHHSSLTPDGIGSRESVVN